MDDVGYDYDFCDNHDCPGTCSGISYTLRHYIAIYELHVYQPVVILCCNLCAIIIL